MRFRRRLAVAAAAVLVSLALAVPVALANPEAGYKSCGGSSHVYTKAKWQTSFSSWLDITSDGIREHHASDTNGGLWEIDYLNLYGWGVVYTNIDNAYWSISGTVLAHSSSWPGCEAD